MTEIDVPDWVVKAADEAGDEFAKTHTMSMYASLADMQRDCVRHMLTAALGAWVVPVACARPHDIHEVDVGNEMAMPTWNLKYRGTTSDLTLYVLRQEKPE